jgi:hypothetical protein
VRSWSVTALSLQLGTAARAAIVAEMALAAPGRVDLVDTLIEQERRTAVDRFRDWPPTAGVMLLLEATRRVTAGEVALVGRDGERVEQIRVDRLDGAGTRTLLRLSHHGQVDRRLPHRRGARPARRPRAARRGDEHERRRAMKRTGQQASPARCSNRSRWRTRCRRQSRRSRCCRAGTW